MPNGGAFWFRVVKLAIWAAALLSSCHIQKRGDNAWIFWKYAIQQYHRSG